ncbi:hypothetical protein CFRS1_v013558 [Colletotrichum fructicola]|nr:hypothetical protein CFRS1_v013558 [Colletotrichum fructicola]
MPLQPLPETHRQPNWRQQGVNLLAFRRQDFYLWLVQTVQHRCSAPSNPRVHLCILLRYDFFQVVVPYKIDTLRSL